MKLVAMIASGILLSNSAHAALLWDESIDGDFSNVAATPTSLSVLLAGDYEVLGSVHAQSDPYDAFSFDIPSGGILSAFFVREIVSTFNDSPVSLRRGATGTDTVVEFGLFPFLSAPGLDLLQIGSQPGPQPPGTYTFTAGPPNVPPGEDTPTAYRLEIQVTSVPEPSSLILTVLSLLLLVSTNAVLSGGILRAGKRSALKPLPEKTGKQADAL
jgi:hypothetical protein